MTEFTLTLHTLKKAKANKSARRVGRGIGSGFGKTCGRGHKGQKSRSGGGIPVWFEGGQNPLVRCLPKFGFTSRVGLTAVKLPLSALKSLTGEVTLQTLIDRNLVSRNTKTVKVYLSGQIENAVKLKGIRCTKGARAAIEKAGGEVA